MCRMGLLFRCVRVHDGAWWCVVVRDGVRLSLCQCLSLCVLVSVRKATSSTWQSYGTTRGAQEARNHRQTMVTKIVPYPTHLRMRPSDLEDINAHLDHPPPKCVSTLLMHHTLLTHFAHKGIASELGCRDLRRAMEELNPLRRNSVWRDKTSAECCSAGGKRHPSARSRTQEENLPHDPPLENPHHTL